MDLSTIVVCSFYTADPYYRGHADSLRANLDRLGIAYELGEIEKEEGEEWPDICRKKVPFLAGVCDKYPDKKVFWTDVDCQLLSLPEFVANFSADIVGFQRGFSAPLSIGYRSRTRFWEPCFFGINATEGARKFVYDARDMEASSSIRATDDFFFEESWRSNAYRLSFQMIPSICVVSRAQPDVLDVPVFFSFGDSGNVAEYKEKVVQHSSIDGPDVPQMTVGERAKLWALGAAKGIERRLPESASGKLRQIADVTGTTHFLTGGGADALRTGHGSVVLPGSPHRRRIVDKMVMSAQRGDVAQMNEAFVRLATAGVPSRAEMLAHSVSESFAHFAQGSEDEPFVQLAWWPRPFPGNFGDWLSPLVLSAVSNRPVRYVSPTARISSPHVVGVGSIGRFVKPSSVVVGTGVSSLDTRLESSAEWISTRGPLTAALLAECGGPTVESFGDPGALLARIMPFERAQPNGKLALVRHFTHARIPLMLPADTEELDVLMSHPDTIRSFVEQLHQYDGIVTSAMHVMIVCHSYGIPCALIGFEGFESTVHGSGVKYRDYSLGAGLDAVHEPQVVGIDLRRANLRSRLSLERISEEKLDEIESAVRRSAERCLERLAEIDTVS